ncbi:DoxX family protein [Nocardioides jiangxiensis]|uniref:DoxX family protein n=1 Tax=Nocardioides jiangxiensis TaxID=3064524 RepID=A0ABT9AZS7_9ACTN|nr:DoxX family protein [Nocardioides sp. WY-20]MDO7868099.1 DoxX family protein [Nocardioides sp. WY-20]
MDIVLLVGRILFVVLFLLSAVGHFAQTDYMAGYAKSKGLPFAKLNVLASGLVFGLAGLAIAFGVYGDLAGIVLALVLVPTALIFHTFWKEQGEAKAMTQIMFNKDLALAGGALALAFAFSTNPGLTLTNGLFA